MSYQYPVLDPRQFQNPNLNICNNQPQNPNMYFYNQPVPMKTPVEEEKEEIKEIVHQVNPCDTLFGISLQYDVPLERIKTYNNLHTDDIYYLKELKIPNASKFFSSFKIKFFLETICFPPYNDEDVMQTTRRQL